MEINEATIDILREEGQLRSVSVVMPIWDKVEGDQSIIIEIPLFGTKTFVFDDIDANQAIDDAIKFFCKNSEKFGKGLEYELLALGWDFCDSFEENKTTMSFTIPSKDTVLEQIMNTGEKQAKVLELA